MEPIQPAQHKSRAKAGGVPLFEIPVDYTRMAAELAPRPLEKLSVVEQVMHPYFEAFANQVIAELGRNVIAALGNEIEGRLEPETDFEFHQLPGLEQPCGALDIVGENQRELFGLGPPGPAFWGMLRAGQHRPGP